VIKAISISPHPVIRLSKKIEIVQLPVIASEEVDDLPASQRGSLFVVPPCAQIASVASFVGVQSLCTAPLLRSNSPGLSRLTMTHWVTRLILVMVGGGKSHPVVHWVE